MLASFHLRMPLLLLIVIVLMKHIIIVFSTIWTWFLWTVLKCWHSMPSKKASTLLHPNHYPCNFRHLWRFVDKSKLKGERRVLTIITRSGSITGCYHKLLWESRHDGKQKCIPHIHPDARPISHFQKVTISKVKTSQKLYKSICPPLLSPKREKRKRHVIFTYRNFEIQNKSNFLQVHKIILQKWSVRKMSKKCK